LGTIYLDLFERPNKFNGWATFSIKLPKKNVITPSETVYLPSITALVGSFDPQLSRDLLVIGSVRVLFHEVRFFLIATLSKD